MALHHFSHEHQLILKEELDANGDDKIVCYGCRKPIIRRGSAADVFICSSSDGCDDFYLHKTCAELPKEIKHPMHDQHTLTLHARPPYYDFSCFCNVCQRDWEGFTYNCLGCNFDSCVTCTFEDREFHHIGHKHKQHTLTLMQREALFKCDACGTEAKDLSYACNSCQFWIHKSCASSPTSVEPNFHHHPLVLTYSLPHIHRTFTQYCQICKNTVHKNYWLYYCHKCTYFVHIKCVASSETSTSGEKDDTEVELQRDVHNLVQFPVPTKESFMNLIIDQFAKGNINLEEGEASPDHPQIIKHWSHGVHPLILLEELQRSENNEMLICNGCVQPISTAHLFYGCIRCNFFLHRFCVELPLELPAGAHSCHPEHPLLIYNNENKFYIVQCDACGIWTNGFYFWCKTCEKRFDIGCCFLPNRIKHESHKHPLINYDNPASTKFACRACASEIVDDYFKCEIACSSFQIDKDCAYLLPRTVRHRWDPHPIHLIYPPFPHEGVIYCEICEEEIDPNYWLYHCSECDQSFHTSCLYQRHNVKLGDKLVVAIHPHTLTFVWKKKSVYCRPLLCCSCGWEHLGQSFCLCFECANCDILFCTACVTRNL